MLHMLHQVENLSSEFVIQSEVLTTITARYSLREDRIVVDGVIHTGDELQFAFTLRLARGPGRGARPAGEHAH